MRKMKLDELAKEFFEALKDIAPGANIGEDNEGQVVIYTGWWPTRVSDDYQDEFPGEEE